MRGHTALALSEYPIMFFLLCVGHLVLPVIADINSGCPSWGCLPQGTFSFSSRIPTASNQLKWSTEIDQTNGTLDQLSVQGCVSDQQSVVCATPRLKINIIKSSFSHVNCYNTRLLIYHNFQSRDDIIAEY